MIKIKTNNITELLNCLYGDNEDYDYINKKDLKTIIKEHQKSLEKIYKKLEETDFNTLDIYNLGDVINLLELFKDVEIEEEIKINNIKKKLNNLVKQEYLWSYELEDNELILYYGLSSVRDTMRVIDITSKDLKQALLESAEELRIDIESSLVDNNDYFGYDTKEELEDRIVEETEYLKLLSELI